MSSHALLSASSSHRWMHCPPSARLGENYEDRTSDFAAEGTEAHALCEYQLKTTLAMSCDDPRGELQYYTEEMENCAVGYAAYIMELLAKAKETCVDPLIFIEQRLDYSKFVKDGFGTGDCVLVADGTLHIIDYKHGKGVRVEAIENPQMMLYALGACELLDGIYDIEDIAMTIYQPRLGNISTYTISKAELYQWATDVLEPAAKLAFAGEGNYQCGEWCRFCKAKH